jgi:CubicO group peptidase (beta-lactamase class C family)
MEILRTPPPGARADAPGWAAAIFDRDHIQKVWCAGHADLREHTSVEPSTPFRWFSITKLATACAVMSLVDRGLLSLDDRVDRHLAFFTPSPRDPAVTIRHLLSHSAGLDDPSPLDWVHPPLRAKRTQLALTRELARRHRRLRSAPGGAPLYTNLGYLLLGEIVRAVSKSPFESFVRSAVLAPAGLARTDFEPRGATGHERLRSLRSAAMALVFAPRTRGLIAYAREGWVGLTPFELEGQAYGGLVGSLEDLARLGRLHLGGGAIDGVRVLSPELARAMQQRENASFGLGFWMLEGGWIGHGGWAGGFRSELRIHPARGIGVAVLANSGTARAIEIAEALAG